MGTAKDSRVATNGVEFVPEVIMKTNKKDQIQSYEADLMVEDVDEAAV